MAQILSYSPGQIATLYLEVKDSDGYYADSDGYIDGYESPVFFRLIKPDFTLDGNYPQSMTKFDTGIYYYQFRLPTGASAVGSYFADIAYIDPDSFLTKFNAFQILVNAPFGIYSVNTS